MGWKAGVTGSESFVFGCDKLKASYSDRMQRNFDPVRQQVKRWRAQQLFADAAKLTIYQAFIEGDLDIPKHLARRVHELYFNPHFDPEHDEFEPRTMWSLSNAFTSAFKALDPIPQFKANSQAGRVLESAVLRVVLAHIGRPLLA